MIWKIYSMTWRKFVSWANRKKKPSCKFAISLGKKTHSISDKWKTGAKVIDRYAVCIYKRKKKKMTCLSSYISFWLQDVCFKKEFFSGLYDMMDKIIGSDSSAPIPYNNLTFWTPPPTDDITCESSLRILYSTCTPCVILELEEPYITCIFKQFSS